MEFSRSETFGGYLWNVFKNPIQSLWGSPLTQSIAAFSLNLWFLVVAVLGQVWVIFSAILLGIQAINIWRVYLGRGNRVMAVVVGLVLVAINYAALSLAVLGQFWVVGSTALASWQFLNLLRVCMFKKYRLKQAERYY